MKKLGVFGLVLVCSVLLTANIAPAATHTVCASGCMHTTIQDAVNDALTGDIIIVKPGTYNESVTVNKQVQILGGATGTGKLKTFVNAPAINGFGFLVASPNVVISGFTIRGGTSSPGAGIVISTVDNVRVKYCTVEKSAYGIIIAGGGGASNIRLAYNQVRYNTAMAGAGIGILVQSNGATTPNIIMSYNQINDNDGYGIMVQGTGGSSPSFNGMLIQYNTLVNNGSDDLTGPSNHNSKGFYFIDAAGNIALKYNKIRATDPPGNELVLAGPAVPVFLFTGNLKLPNAKNTPAGPGVPFP